MKNLLHTLLPTLVGLMLILALIALSTVKADETPAPEMVVIKINMLASRLEECKNRGGCSFLTKAEMAEMYEAGRTAGKAEAFESLDFHGCRVDRS